MKTVGSRRMLERDSEVEAIGDALDFVIGGSGAALIIEGPAGIGKTRLLTQACERGSSAGMTVLEARAAEFEGAYTWGVVRQLFGGVLGNESSESSGLLGGAARLAIPALGLGAPEADGVEDVFSVLHGLYWLAVDLAHGAPLLIAVDDAHWADASSLRFIAHLVRRLEGLRILVALSAHPSGSHRAGDRLLLDIIATDASTVVLRPAALGKSACAALIADALGTEPAPGFGDACYDITGGNPFLLDALLGSLVAEGVRGAPPDIEHVRRMTPASVSRRVLLALGRMPPPTLAIARALAVLGTGATVSRACRLAQVERTAGLDAIAALIAERVIEGEDTLPFVHPLVRAAVYHDLAAPQLQHWHERAARALADEAAPLDQIAAHLLAAGKNGDGWLVGMLRRAALDARDRGAPDLALRYLERARAEPPPEGQLAEVLFELGIVELADSPVRAARDLEHAHALSEEAFQRATIALALAQAEAMSGRLPQAVELLERTIAESADAPAELEVGLQVALLNTARWDLATRPVTRPLLEELRRRAEHGEDLDPLLDASLAIELSAAGTDRQRAVRHIQLALRPTTRRIALSAAVLPEAISVLLFADLHDEALRAVQAWLRPAQQGGLRLASATAASCAALINLYGGAISEAVSWARQALENSAGLLLTPIATAFLIRAMIERGEIEQARTELTQRDLTGELLPTWPFNVLRHARGCLHAAVGAHEAAIEDFTAAGERAQRWGIHNPAMIDWRSAAGLSMHATGNTQEGRRLCAEELDLARRWGAGRAIGVALRRGGVVNGGARGISQLADAVRVLQHAPAPLELAHALTDYGTALRHAGRRLEARGQLRAGLYLAHRQGALALLQRAREELVIAGGRPRRDALRGRDALTPSELRIAHMAADGDTNRQIAQALFITQRTVELHLTNSYTKLGISSRRELAAALDAR